MFVYCILSILLAQYTHEFLFLLINQMFGVKKKEEKKDTATFNADLSDTSVISIKW